MGSLPTLEEIDKDRLKINRQYSRYLKLFNISDIEIRAKRILELFDKKNIQLQYKDKAKFLFAIERDESRTFGDSFIQSDRSLQYIKKVHEILDIDFKCKECIVNPICCNYQSWLSNQNNNCDGVEELLYGKFTCFFTRKYLFN